MQVPLAIFFLSDCTAAVVLPNGLGNFCKNFLANLAIKLLTHSVYLSLSSPNLSNMIVQIFTLNSLCQNMLFKVVDCSGSMRNKGDLAVDARKVCDAFGEGPGGCQTRRGEKMDARLS